ncbi:restriction endonuclease [Corynebacterium vitaeruminis]|uniref:winged helix-turn-helix domain-containing protein n=1 Tax=Corynebacterium vitaeruminis TaxID=38305 RepID=UPI0004B83B26|nr:winged helix-turn-helix domain-containing protein [Corynebacterium vitaeruminis]
MPIRTWDGYLIPLLTALSDGEVWRRKQLIEKSAEISGITDEDRTVLIPSGQQMYVNRNGWALSDLKKAGCVESPMRAHFRITQRGRELLARYPEGINPRQMRQAIEDSGSQGTAWIGIETGAVGVDKQEQESLLDPVEQIETGVARNDASVAADLLARLHGNDPEFFEQAVLDLLIAMGYGGTQGKATRTQLSNNGGIDGIIDQDALGLSRIYVQAKRYEPSIAIAVPRFRLSWVRCRVRRPTVGCS